VSDTEGKISCIENILPCIENNLPCNFETIKENLHIEEKWGRGETGIQERWWNLLEERNAQCLVEKQTFTSVTAGCVTAFTLSHGSVVSA